MTLIKGMHSEYETTSSDRPIPEQLIPFYLLARPSRPLQKHFGDPRHSQALSCFCTLDFLIDSYTDKYHLLIIFALKIALWRHDPRFGKAEKPKPQSPHKPHHAI